MEYVEKLKLVMQVGPSFSAHQPVIFNPQATPVPQQFFHPNGPQVCQFFGLSAYKCTYSSVILEMGFRMFKILIFLMQYGQQMMIGHPRQVVYMPSYPSVSNLLTFYNYFC